MKVQIESSKCKACGLCIEYCPTKAITFTGDINQQGYKTTSVDDDVCIGCGICYTVCPDGVYTVNANKKEVKQDG